MYYIAEEKDVKDTVVDFMRFCDFIETAKPFATQKGDLSVKACYEVNKLLRYPEQNAKDTARMHQYATVALWFIIAKQAGFIACFDAKGGKSICGTTDKYADFKTMNIFSQYLLIFHIWFCFVDPEAQYGERGFTSVLSDLMDGIFSQLAENGSNQWIKYEENKSGIYGRNMNPVQFMMGMYYKTACTLRDLNLIDFVESNKSIQYFNLPLIEQLKPKNFGVALSKACEQRKYVWFNAYAEKAYIGLNWFADKKDFEDEEELYEKTMEALKNGTTTFISPFLSCFPEKSVDMPAIYASIFEHENLNNDTRVFEFKVSLSKRCYRTIRCLPEHTFEDLHLAIQKAFEFDNDHLYSFYLDGKRHSSYEISAPYSERPPFTDEVRLGDERLTNRQRILYLFDYGDCWEFDIVLDVKNETDLKLKNPEIIKSVGESPEQYPDLDYEDDDDIVSSLDE
ncbi:MAG: plasmid pRiA4b ORF-3 family protein [Oscillospiraceae bacterium]|nr:plasmid pRiA4b ORF-3 family protein [Oscillospiraceae bacterium]